MTEAIQKEQGAVSLSGIWSALRDPALQLRNLDRLAVLIAILLPWSTTGVGIAVVLWLIALVPTVEPRALWRSLARPAAALPLVLVARGLGVHSLPRLLHAACAGVRNRVSRSELLGKALFLARSVSADQRRL